MNIFIPCLRIFVACPRSGTKKEIRVQNHHGYGSDDFICLARKPKRGKVDGGAAVVVVVPSLMVGRTGGGTTLWAGCGYGGPELKKGCTTIRCRFSFYDLSTFPIQFLRVLHLMV
ncbi:hypothetical protein HanPI659440_Chr13g0516111 [Helianthus annuus]|nr:hypothetical protein HanPI659440_Chr13g0516111 [Helianthus annuus]